MNSLYVLIPCPHHPATSTPPPPTLTASAAFPFEQLLGQTHSSHMAEMVRIPSIFGPFVHFCLVSLCFRMQGCRTLSFFTITIKACVILENWKFGRWSWNDFEQFRNIRPTLMRTWNQPVLAADKWLRPSQRPLLLLHPQRVSMSAQNTCSCAPIKILLALLVQLHPVGEGPPAPSPDLWFDQAALHSKAASPPPDSSRKAAICNRCYEAPLTTSDLPKPPWPSKK